MLFKPAQLRPRETGARRALGNLEADVMEQMWCCDTATVRDVHERLSARELAYTTVMTVMSRLADKGLLDKHKGGKQFVYRATVTRIEFETSVTRSFLSGIMGTLDKIALASFVDHIDDEHSLAELEALIKEKKGGTTRTTQRPSTE